MSRLIDAVHKAATDAVAQSATAWVLASVTATHTDGTVDIRTATGTLSSIRRIKAYSSPAVNDVVVVLTSPNGNWIVLGALATS